MKFFTSIFSLFFLFNYLTATIPPCSQHSGEIRKIRGNASSSLVEAHKLTGDIIGSFVVTIEDIAWNAVKYNSTYSDFAKTFQGCIQNCNSEGKFLASNRLYQMK